MTLGAVLDSIFKFRNSSANYNASVLSYKLCDIAINEKEVKEELSFTVTFNAGTGATGGPLTYTYDSKTAVATANGTAAGTKPEATFSKTGHDFLGWSTTNGATTAAIGSAGLLSTAVGTPTNGGTYTLYAVWGPKTYTITYYYAGSGVTGVTVPSAGSATHGSNYTVSSTTPTFTVRAISSTVGSILFGWYRCCAGGTISNVTSNITLTAKWIARYTVYIMATVTRQRYCSGNRNG